MTETDLGDKTFYNKNIQNVQPGGLLHWLKIYICLGNLNISKYLLKSPQILYSMSTFDMRYSHFYIKLVKSKIITLYQL